MHANDRDRGTWETGEALRRLLDEHADYRDRWRRFVRRPAAASVNQAAVAQVLALHLWETGERAESEHDLPRRLKDRVRRALAGEVVSPQTLTWFIEAFAMAERDRETLWSLCVEGGAKLDRPVINTLRIPQFVPIRQRHHTISAFENRTIGPDGWPVSHRTIRAIVADEDGVDSYPYRLVPGARRLRVHRGGRVSRRHHYSGSSPILEIALPRPLQAGEVASMEYEVEFAPGPSIPPEYRRVAHAPAQNVDIVVSFHHDRRPRSLWWTLWDDYRNGTVLEEEPAELDQEDSVHRFVPCLENAAAGFRWTW